MLIVLPAAWRAAVLALAGTLALASATTSAASAAKPRKQQPTKAMTKAPTKASRCERALKHVTALMKRMVPHLPAAARAKVRAQLRRQHSAKAVCKRVGSLKPGLAACLLRASRLSGLRRCQKEFGGKSWKKPAKAPRGGAAKKVGAR
jgi:hypothetical protein